MRFRLGHLFLFTTLFAAVVVAVGSCLSSRQVHGVGCFFLHLASVSICVLVVLCSYWILRFRTFSAVLLLIVCLSIAFNNWILESRLRALGDEVSGILAHLESYHDANFNAYPSCLKHYAFCDATLKDCVEYTVSPDSQSFHIRYHPTNKWSFCLCRTHGIHHGYKSQIGYYFEDD